MQIATTCSFNKYSSRYATGIIFHTLSHPFYGQSIDFKSIPPAIIMGSFLEKSASPIPNINALGEITYHKIQSILSTTLVPDVNEENKSSVKKHLCFEMVIKLYEPNIFLPNSCSKNLIRCSPYCYE